MHAARKMFTKWTAIGMAIFVVTMTASVMQSIPAQAATSPAAAPSSAQTNVASDASMVVVLPSVERSSTENSSGFFTDPSPCPPGYKYDPSNTQSPGPGIPKGCVPDSSPAIPNPIGGIASGITNWLRDNLAPLITTAISDALKLLGDVVNPIFDAVAGWIIQGIAGAVCWVSVELFQLATDTQQPGAACDGKLQGSTINGTPPGLESAPFLKVYEKVMTVAFLLLLPILMFALFQALIKQTVRELLQPIAMLPVMTIGLAIVIPIIQVFQTFSRGVTTFFATGVSSDISQFFNGITGISHHLLLPGPVGGVMEIFLLIIILFVVLFAGFAIWVVFLVLDMGVYMAALLLPLGFAFLIWPTTAKWFFTQMKLLIGLLIAKPAVVAILALSAALMAGQYAGADATASRGTGTGATPTTTQPPVVGGGSGPKKSAPLAARPIAVEAVLTGSAIPQYQGTNLSVLPGTPQDGEPDGNTFRRLLTGAAVFFLAAIAPFKIIEIVGSAFGAEVGALGGIDGALKGAKDYPGRRIQKAANSAQLKQFAAAGGPLSRQGAIISKIPGLNHALPKPVRESHTKGTGGFAGHGASPEDVQGLTSALQANTKALKKSGKSGGGGKPGGGTPKAGPPGGGKPGGGTPKAGPPGGGTPKAGPPGGGTPKAGPPGGGTPGGGPAAGSPGGGGRPTWHRRPSGNPASANASGSSATPLPSAGAAGHSYDSASGRPWQRHSGGNGGGSGSKEKSHPVAKSVGKGIGQGAVMAFMA